MRRRAGAQPAAVAVVLPCVPLPLVYAWFTPDLHRRGAQAFNPLPSPWYCPACGVSVSAPPSVAAAFRRSRLVCT
jgi:hypothetical protein